MRSNDDAPWPSRRWSGSASVPNSASPSDSAWRRDLFGGALAAVVMLPVEGSYGLIAFAVLGPQYLRFGFASGIYAAVLSNLLVVLLGARGPLLAGSSAALALLVAPLLAALATRPGFLLPDGRPDAAAMLAVMALGIALAGAVQIGLGALRIGGIVRYIPFPVHAGFMNGVAVLMIIAMLPHVLGVASGATGTAWRDARPLTLLVALPTAWLALRPPRCMRNLPAYLVALLVGTALFYLLRALAGEAALGPTVGRLDFGWPDFDVLAPLASRPLRIRFDAAGPLLFQFVLAVALMSTLQSLLASSVVDSLTGERRDGERELLGQGVANLAAGIFGALPGAGAMARSKVNLNVGGTTHRSRLAFACCLLLAAALGSSVLRYVPMAAIGALFVSVALSLVDPWSWRSTATVWRAAVRLQRPGGALLQGWVVMVVVAATAVFFSLLYGVVAGMLISMLLFVGRNSRSPIRSITSGDCRRSRQVRPPATMEWLRAHGQRIAVLELDGALFFGTADAAAREVERLVRCSDYLIVDFRRVSQMDASGARVLAQAGQTIRAAGKHLLLASIATDDARADALRGMDLQETFSDALFFPDLDSALEAAENLLLDESAPRADEYGELTLGQTVLCAGLGTAEVALLERLMETRRLAKGEHVFERGDPGDRLYVSLRGRIAIRLAADAPCRHAAGRRLVSFAPGVVFGEMGLLQSQPRSAAAIAEDDGIVLSLSRMAFDLLGAQEPMLLGKLMRNLSSHLSARIRALTDDLQATLDAA
jgi:sulfate permease, SulP family